MSGSVSTNDVIQRISSAFETLIKWMNAAGVTWIFALMFLICADIAGRTLFDSPIQAVPEIVAFSLVGCIFLQLAFAVQTNRLTRAEVFLEYIRRSNPQIGQILQLIAAGMGCFVLTIITIGTLPDFWRAFQTSEFTGVEGIYTLPISPIKFTVVLGSAAAAFEFLRQLFKRPAYIMSPAQTTKVALGTVVTLGSIALASILFETVGLADRTVGALAIITVLVFIALGVPISISLLIVGFIGVGILKRDFNIATDTLSLTTQGTVAEYVFATVPLFVLMGLFVSVSEIGRDSFRAAQQIFGRFRGGLGVATVAANAVFAAITGISIASAAIFAKIAVPEMVSRGYTPRFSVGLTAGSSVLGMLIPPSLLLIIYGVIAEVSIGALFVAAIIPGIILAAAFGVGVIAMAFFWPTFVGRVDTLKTGPDSASPGNFIGGIMPVLMLILLVLGGIYGGVFTPTEAGAAGALAAMCIALVKRRLTISGLWEVIRETGQVSVTILFLIVSASTFSRMLTLTGLPADMAGYLGGGELGLMGFLAAYLLLLIVLGTVLDSTSILLILLPLVLPVVTELGGNLVWFGIVTVIGVEIGLLTPPLGLSVYVIKSTLDDDNITLGTIFSGALPFVLITMAVTILIMAFPSLSLMLL